MYAKAKTNAYKKVFACLGKWNWQWRHQAKLRGILNIFYVEQRRRRNFFLLWHMNKPSTTKGLNCCTLTEEKTFPHTVLWHKYYGYFVCSDKVYFGKTQMKWWINSILSEQLCSLVHAWRFLDILTKKHICPRPTSAILASRLSLGARGRRGARSAVVPG